MARDLTSGMVTAIDAQFVRVAAAIEAEFGSGTIWLWTGAASLSWDSKTWVGLGNLIGASEVEEGVEISAKGVTLSLSGVPSELLALTEDDYRNRPLRIWLLKMNEAFDAVDESYLQFAGRMDTMTIEDTGSTATISMQCESNLADLARPRVVRYTDAEQKRLHPGDRGLEFVAALAEKPLYWGVPTP